MNATVDTVNAAATAIVSAEARSQPNPLRQKRRWGSCWSMYWCFGHQKTKRIGHAVLAPAPAATTIAAPATVNPAAPAPAIVLPFIAPPSSPASFLPSDPPSATQSPAGPLSLTSLASNAYSHRGPASIFAVGPYAYDTQLVSPPVFSTFTTEPSTAPFTPPPESLQLTTPSSPEVPFAQLLTSSLERRGGVNQKFSLSHYEFQGHQLYPGSPGSQLISPGSVVSNSGTSSPFLGKQPILERRIGEAPKVLGFEHFSTWKWGSRLGSGSITPDGAGLRSRLGSGTVTPDGMGIGSRLSSGCLTPDGLGPLSHDTFVHPKNQKAATAFVPTFLHNGPKHEETLMDHRVSFELTGEDVARCLANKSANSLSRFPQDNLPGIYTEQSRVDDSKNCRELSTENSVDGTSGKAPGEGEKEPCYQRQRSVTLGSTNEFKFDNRNGGMPQKVGGSSEWWANEKVGGKEDVKAGNSWSFFPMLQPEVS